MTRSAKLAASKGLESKCGTLCHARLTASIERGSNKVVLDFGRFSHSIHIGVLVEDC
jgi:hypothetical protein